MKNKTRHFNALKPKELLIYFKEKYSSLKNILPELNKLSSQKEEEIVCELFQGKEGLKTILKDLIDSKKNYKVIGIKKEYEELLGYFNEQGILNLNDSRVKEIAIVERGTKFKKLKYGKYKYLEEGWASSITTLIYSNKTIFFIWTEPYLAIRIQNKKFFEFQENSFDLLWSLAKSN